MRIAPVGSAAPHRKRRTLIMVFDGLRPGSITAGGMPNLHRLAMEGVTFTRSRTGFPSQTLVGAGELFAGSYPERSGITGNMQIVPGGPVEGVDLKTPRAMEQVARAYGAVMPATSLFQALSGARQTSLVVGKTGPVELAFAAGATWAVSPDSAQSRRGQTGPELRALSGAAPSKHAPDGARSRWIANSAIAIQERVRPDVTVVWFTDPDASQHDTGINSAASRSAREQVDAAAGMLLRSMRSRGLLQDTNVVVASDHGFSAVDRSSGAKDVRGVLERAGLVVSHVTAAGNQHVVRFAQPPSAQQLEQATRALATASFADRISTVIANPRGADADTRDDARLTGGDLRQGSERSGDIFVVYQRTGGRRGQPGTNVDADPHDLVASHGGLGWSDVNNTLVLAGPDVERGATTANAAGIFDVAPTVLHLQGVRPPAGMQGRILDEALRDGVPGVRTRRSRRIVATSSSTLGTRTITNRLVTEGVGRARYFERFSTTG